MEENKLTHRAGLVREATEILNRYTPYAAERRVTFQTAENSWLTSPGWNGPAASPWLEREPH
ncbi:MAG: hypothetical protein ACLT9P_06445 [Evtepia gabavorous]